MMTTKENTMDFSKYEHLKISDTTKISELYLLGLIPEFIYKDCKLHGLEEAENILCEWDWEDGWDLGDDYDEEQMETLRNIRKFIAHKIGWHDWSPSR